MERKKRMTDYLVEQHGDQGRTRHGSPIFYDLLERMAQVHDKKSHDYASNQDPYGNYHFAGKLASLFAHSHEDAGFVGRLGEKLYRLANLESSQKIAQNESIADTEIDICVIVTLWMASRRDRRNKNKIVKDESMFYGKHEIGDKDARKTSLPVDKREYRQD